MVRIVIRLVFAVLVVIASMGCAHTNRGGTALESGSAAFASLHNGPDCKIEFVKLMTRGLDARPVDWAVFKVKNTGRMPLGSRMIRILRTGDSALLYGGANSAYHNDPSHYGVSAKNSLEPGETAYVSVALRDNYTKGDVIRAQFQFHLDESDMVKVVYFTAPSSAPTRGQ